MEKGKRRSLSEKETLSGKVQSERQQCLHTKSNTVKEKDKELLVRAGIALPTVLVWLW